MALVAVAAAYGRLDAGPPTPAIAALESTDVPPSPAHRTSCAEIGASDLRSPLEGLWFQSNCAPILEPGLTAISTKCNRVSLESTFAPVAPGLYVSRQSPAAQGFLWYASSEACFDLVSARAVTAVCADQTVSFSGNARSVCSSRGGVLAWVNGR